MFLSEPSTTFDIYTKGIAILAIVATSKFAIKILSKMHKSSVPVEGIPMAPNSNWLTGHSHLFLKNFKETWTTLAYDNANDEGVSSFWLFSRPIMTVNTIEHVIAILSATSSTAKMGQVKKHGIALVGETVIGLLNGKEWGHIRAIFKKGMSGSSLESMLDHIHNTTASMVKSLDNKISLQHQGRPIELNIEYLLELMIADISGKIFFGLDFDCCNKFEEAQMIKEYKFLAGEVNRRIKSPLNPAARFYSIPTALTRRHKQSITFVRKTLRAVVEERKHCLATASFTDSNNDFITSLLKSGDSLNIDHMVNNMIGAHIGAFGSPITSLSYIFYCIAMHADVEQECLNEIDRELNEGNGALNHEKLVYCDAVVKETLRLHSPVISVNRSIEKPYKFKDVTVKAGTNVFIPIWHIQRDERHFHRAEEFLPERWVKRAHNHSWVPHTCTSSGEKTAFDKEASSTINNYVRPAEHRNFLSFSAGGRNCVGTKLAMKEMRIIMVELIRNFKFEVKEGFELNPINIATVHHTISGGIPMVISKRDM